MKKGQHYFMEGRHVERDYSDHFTVAVEIEKDDASGHHHAMKEIQEISAIPDVQYELTRVTINNPDSQDFMLIFKHPTSGKNIASRPCKGRGTASKLYWCIIPYYRSLGTEVSVSTELYNADGEKFENL